MLYSFDVFDTLITRRTADPMGVFCYMQNRLLKLKDNQYPNELINNFAFIRFEAEKYVRKFLFYFIKEDEFFPQDITLQQIYDRLAFNFDLTEDQKMSLMNLEIQSEIDLVYPIKENIDKLKNHIKNSKVILISDMYLPSDSIRRLLVAVDEVFKDIKIYVSSETKRTKHTGDMYDLVKNEENVNSDWIHYGDNEHSDVYMANQKGIKSVYCPQKNKLDVENKYLHGGSYRGSVDNLTGQFIVGLSDLVKLKTDNNRAILGASYAAPMFIGYIEFIVQKALSKNIKTLYFIARDGFILKKMVDKYIKYKNLGIKTKYIYGSRKSFRVYIDVNNAREFLSFNIYGNLVVGKKLKDIAETLGLSEDILLQKNPELKPFLFKKMSVKNINKIINIFIQNESFLTYLQNDVYSKKQTLVKEYFKQEIDFNETFAFIDSHGTGFTASIMDSMISEISNNSNYYHIFFNLENSNQKGNNYLSYFFGGDDFWVLETLLRSDHGQTLEYKKEENGIISPILSAIEVLEIKDWGIYDYIEGIDLFMDEYLSMMDNIDIQLNYQDIINFYQYAINYDYFLMKSLSSIPYGIAIDVNKIQEFAPKYRWSDVFIFLFNKKHLENISQKYKFSINISGKNVVKTIFFINKVRNILRNLIYIRNLDKGHKKYKIICLFGIRVKIRKK